MMKKLLEARDEMTRDEGVRAIDAVLTVWQCPLCRSPVTDAVLRTVGDVPYRNLPALVLWAEQVCGELAWVEPPACPDCGRRTRPAHLDYHAWHSGERRDLVVRQRPARWFRRARTELLWWDPLRGHRPLGALTAGATRTVTRDAYLRAVYVALDRGSITEALPLLDQAAATLEDDPLLLDLVPPLLAGGFVPMAEKLVSRHLAVRPDSAQGRFWRGRIALHLVDLGRWPIDRLDEAEADLRRAVAEDPGQVAARQALEELADLRAARTMGRRREPGPEASSRA